MNANPIQSIINLDKVLMNMNHSIDINLESICVKCIEFSCCVIYMAVGDGQVSQVSTEPTFVMYGQPNRFKSDCYGPMTSYD